MKTVLWFWLLLAMTGLGFLGGLLYRTPLLYKYTYTLWQRAEEDEWIRGSSWVRWCRGEPGTASWSQFSARVTEVRE